METSLQRLAFELIIISWMGWGGSGGSNRQCPLIIYRSRIRVRRNSLLHRARKRGVIVLRNRSITPQLKERRGMENFSYLVEDVAYRLFALVFYLVYTKFHLLGIRIRETSAACFLTWIRFLMFGLVSVQTGSKTVPSPLSFTRTQ